MAKTLARLLGSLPVDTQDLRLLAGGLILLVALGVVVLTLAGLAGLAVAVFQEARGV